MPKVFCAKCGKLTEERKMKWMLNGKHQIGYCPTCFLRIKEKRV